MTDTRTKRTLAGMKILSEICGHCEHFGRRQNPLTSKYERTGWCKISRPNQVVKYSSRGCDKFRQTKDDVITRIAED